MLQLQPEFNDRASSSQNLSYLKGPNMDSDLIAEQTYWLAPGGELTKLAENKRCRLFVQAWPLNERNLWVGRSHTERTLR